MVGLNLRHFGSVCTVNIFVHRQKVRSFGESVLAHSQEPHAIRRPTYSASYKSRARTVGLSLVYSILISSCIDASPFTLLNCIAQFPAQYQAETLRSGIFYHRHSRFRRDSFITHRVFPMNV